MTGSVRMLYPVGSSYSSDRSCPRHHGNVRIVREFGLNTEKNPLRIFLHNCFRDPENDVKPGPIEHVAEQEVAHA